MGKILSYLGIQEKDQTKDTLEAERLLEGMQMLYASAPDSPKKDSLGMVLAEMTRTFIEKIKLPETPEPEYEEVDLPFKVGDVFMLESEKDDPIHSYIIKDIDFENNKVSYQKKKLSDKSISVKTEEIVDVADYIENGKWINLVAPIPKQKQPSTQPQSQPIPVPKDIPKRPEKKPKRVVDTEKERKIKELLNMDINDIEL